MSSYVSKSFILVRFYRSVSRIHIKPSPLVIEVYRWRIFAQTASVSASNVSLLSIVGPRYLMDNFNNSAMNKNRGNRWRLIPEVDYHVFSFGHIRPVVKILHHRQKINRQMDSDCCWLLLLNHGDWHSSWVWGGFGRIWMDCRKMLAGRVEKPQNWAHVGGWTWGRAPGSPDQMCGRWLSLSATWETEAPTNHCLWFHLSPHGEQPVMLRENRTREAVGHWWSLYTVTDDLHIQSLMVFIYSHWWSLYTDADCLYIQSLMVFIYTHWWSLYTDADCLYIQSLMVFIYTHWWSSYTVTDGLYIQMLVVYIYSHWWSLYTVTDHLYIQSMMVFICRRWFSLHTVTDGLHIQMMVVFI